MDRSFLFSPLGGDLWGGEQGSPDLHCLLETPLSAGPRKVLADPQREKSRAKEALPADPMEVRSLTQQVTLLDQVGEIHGRLWSPPWAYQTHFSTAIAFSLTNLCTWPQGLLPNLDLLRPTWFDIQINSLPIVVDSLREPVGFTLIR